MGDTRYRYDDDDRVILLRAPELRALDVQSDDLTTDQAAPLISIAMWAPRVHRAAQAFLSRPTKATRAKLTAILNEVAPHD